jgi:hypothetical protein
MLLKSVRLYVMAVAAAAVSVAAVVIYFCGWPTEEGAKAAAFFAAFGAFALALGHKGSRGETGSIAFLPFLSAAALCPNWGTLVAVPLAVVAAEVLRRQPIIRAAFNLAQQTLALGLAILTYRALGGGSLAVSSATRNLVPLLGLSLVYFSLNKAAVGAVISLSNRRPIMRSTIESIQASYLYDILATPLILLFAEAYVRFGPLASMCLAVPMLVVRQLYKSNSQLELLNKELLQLMVAAIEARDPYTSGHSQRVAEYSKIVSQAAGLRSKAASRVFTASLLHDVGKIHEEYAPILRKPGRLTDAEYAVMKTHTEKGAALVAKVTQLSDLVQPIRSHHEYWDGRGYPDGLAAAEIPLWARVIAFADTIDAMTTDRPYRRALTPDAVRTEIQAQMGRQFDPEVAAALISEKYWPIMAEAIRRGGATRRPTPFSIEAVPRHSASRRPLPA